MICTNRLRCAVCLNNPDRVTLRHQPRAALLHNLTLHSCAAAALRKIASIKRPCLDSSWTNRPLTTEGGVTQQDDTKLNHPTNPSSHISRHTPPPAAAAVLWWRRECCAKPRQPQTASRLQCCAGEGGYAEWGLPRQPRHKANTRCWQPRDGCQAWEAAVWLHDCRHRGCLTWPDPLPSSCARVVCLRHMRALHLRATAHAQPVSTGHTCEYAPGLVCSPD